MDARSLMLDWLLERAPFGVAWFDGRERIELNVEAMRITGLGERVVPVDRWTQVVRLVDGSGCAVHSDARPLFVAAGGETLPRTRMQVVRSDGTRLDVCVEAFPCEQDGAPAGSIVMVEDITWSLQSEREQAEWLGALGHELNGALQLFLTSTQAAQLYLGRDGSRVLHHLGSAQRQLTHMRRLVRDFVEAARLGAGVFTARPEVVLVDGLLEEIAETAELSDPAHRIQVTADKNLWIHADLDRLRQILTNLMSNAAKYSTPGMLQLGARKDGGRVVFWLRDGGPGISAHAQQRLFHRFRRLPSRTDGSGLGLWIARELAQKMGGDLWVTSAEGGESTFYLAVPGADLLAPEQASGQA